MKGLLQIYSATFLPNIIKIGQHLTSLLREPKGWLLKHSVYKERKRAMVVIKHTILWQNQTSQYFVNKPNTRIC